MRQMAGDREHEVVMVGRHDLDLGAERRPRTRASFSTAAGSVPSGGVRMHQRLMNSSAKPESGPECSVPATGCAGTKCTPCRQIRRHVPHHRALDRADVGDDRAGLEMSGAISCATGPQAPTGMQRMTRSASFTASALVSTHAIDDAELGHPRAGLLRTRGGDDFARQALRPRGARDRAADQPEADQRDAFEERRGAHLPRHEVAQAVDDEAVGLLGADGHAQRMRQAVIVQRAQHQAALGQEGVGLGRGLALVEREMDQHEIRHARRHLEAELADLLGQPVAPFLGVRLRHLD